MTQPPRYGYESFAARWTMFGLATLVVACSQAPDGGAQDLEAKSTMTALQRDMVPVARRDFAVSTAGVGQVHGSQALTGEVRCTAKEGTASMSRPLAGVLLRFSDGVDVATDASGRFRKPLSDPQRHVALTLVYEDFVEHASARSYLAVVDELMRPRTRGIERDATPTEDGGLDLGIIEIEDLDCELFRIGRMALRDYHEVRRASPPQGGLRMTRWAAVHSGPPYAFYDYVAVPTNFYDSDWGKTAWSRQRTLFHEFGHTVRHAADGDETHWHGDNFRWVYARNHRGTEITNVQYAFNEGWAGYWQQARQGNHAATCPGRHPDWRCPEPGYRDWNESLVTDRLLELAAFPGASDRLMLEILEESPGAIHSLSDFEARFAERLGLAPFPPPNACPPEYTDDGATCRRASVVSKPSYVRGAGAAPTDCGPEREWDAGLCYGRCAEGYSGVGPVCWQICPAGYTDDGAVCRRNGEIIGADNSNCPGYDLCGLTFARGCSVCPSGYSNDGCTCRVDPHIFGKSAYGRGVGTVPSSCPADAELHQSLCYSSCVEGFTGLGPVCWGSCPEGFEDQGAVCALPTSIIVK